MKMANSRSIYYIFDTRLIKESKNIPNIGNRASVVQALIFAYNLHTKFKVIPGELATDDDLLSFHSCDYIDCLKRASATSDLEKLADSEEATEFNLEYDCPLFEGIYEFVKTIVGGTLTAARKLTEHSKQRTVTTKKQVTNVVIEPKSYLKFGCKSVVNGNKESVFDLPCDLSFEESQLELVLNPAKKYRIETSSCKSEEVPVLESNPKECPVVVNWFGGWHHAQRDCAEGFCYANDIVIGIQHLLGHFQRVLYIDLDIHHGNGVENAFLNSRRVLTLSLHLYEPGFYPSTGGVAATGLGPARAYAVNVPLHSGITDRRYIRVFQDVFHRTIEQFCPDCIVLQCGADSLAGDPLGGFNLTPAALGAATRSVLAANLPTMVLGGGGYNAANAARCWTYLTSIVAATPLSDDIPDNHYFELFGPDFTLMTSESLRKDENTDESVEKVLKAVFTILNEVSPDVQPLATAVS